MGKRTFDVGRGPHGILPSLIGLEARAIAYVSLLAQLLMRSRRFPAPSCIFMDIENFRKAIVFGCLTRNGVLGERNEMAPRRKRGMPVYQISVRSKSLKGKLVQSLCI